MTTTTPKNTIKGAGPTGAEGKEEAEAADLRRARRNCFVTFMGKMLATELISVLKRKLERMEAEKNAKLVAHTSWPAQQTLQFQPPQPTFNPPFQIVPTFGYNSYPINWQPPQQNQPRLPPPPTAQATQEELPPPPPGPP